jgi:hypothetical protein
MLRRVTLVRADVSEEIITSILKVTRIGELGTTLGRRATRCNIPEYGILHSHCTENRNLNILIGKSGRAKPIWNGKLDERTMLK